MKKNNQNQEKLLNEIAKLQNTDGSFFSCSSDKKDGFLKKNKYKTIFHAALILNCLAKIEHKKAEQIKKKVVKFLLQEKTDDWGFNYWAQNTSEYEKYRIPNDNDDTFVALAGIYQHDRNIFKPKDLAKIVKILTEYEVTEGGPYQTWHIHNPDDKRWIDVDVAVNANIGFMLSLMDIELPNLNKLYDQAIKDDKLKSMFYPDHFSTIYYLSRFYTARKKELLNKIASKKNRLNPLNEAMMVSALVNLGEKKSAKLRLDKLMMRFDQKEPNIFAFCLDPSQNKKKHYSGSKALTLAMIVEAMGKCENEMKEVKKTKSKKNKKTDVYIEKVADIFRKETDSLPAPANQMMHGFLEKILEKDSDGEIILMPYAFGHAVKSDMKMEDMYKLSLVNLYGWIAYTIYDDFLDQEGVPNLLPLANICLKRVVQIYSEFSERLEGFGELFDSMMDDMERANIVETSSYRVDPKKVLHKSDLPEKFDFTISYQKSLPHCLGPTVLLMYAGTKKKEVEEFVSAFEQYLLAKQLNDDAHDYFEDLEKGIVNPATYMMLQDYFAASGKSSFELSDSDQCDEIKKVYWTKTIHKISDMIIDHANTSKQRLKEVKKIENPEFLTAKLDALKGAAKRAIDESIDSAKFIEEFI